MNKDFILWQYQHEFYFWPFFIKFNLKYWIISIVLMCIFFTFLGTSIEITIEERPKSESSDVESTEYAYNRKGQLVVNGYPFLRSVVRGALNTSIEWRCADLRKYKCSARVRTLGKTLKPINLVHNHEPRKQKQFSAIVWNENDWKFEGLKPLFFKRILNRMYLLCKFSIKYK